MRCGYKRASLHGDIEREVRISRKKHLWLGSTRRMEDQRFRVGDGQSQEVKSCESPMRNLRRDFNGIDRLQETGNSALRQFARPKLCVVEPPDARANVTSALRNAANSSGSVEAIRPQLRTRTAKTRRPPVRACRLVNRVDRIQDSLVIVGIVDLTEDTCLVGFLFRGLGWPTDSRSPGSPIALP